jgi:hypothetical protein
MAPTGRAAKILREKTGFGQTIHKTIYNFEELNTSENQDIEDDHSFQYVFPIRQDAAVGKVLIIDEASMVSSRESKNELFAFGTDILLNDLLTYSKVPYASNKLIFVGDPAQLPPVGDNSSRALMSEYFQGLGIKTQQMSLKEVLRQKENAILKNAIKIRSLIGVQIQSQLSLDYDENCFVKTNSEDIASEYAKKFPLPEIGQGVIIAYSNLQCVEYNRAVRRKIFPQNEAVNAGDLLMVINNNYHTYSVELLNGELVKVMDAAHHVISRKNIPVYQTINGSRVKKYVTLHFRKVVIRLANHSEEVECLIIDSLLDSPNRDLTITEMKALYIDFVMRFQEKQNENKAKGLPFNKVGSEAFKQQLKSDQYFNALRVKYGYAITCHKSQGGEWQMTFVDYNGRTGLNDDALRWSYTATTRAIDICFAANGHNINAFSRFVIGEIQALTHIPTDALALQHIPVSPYHSESQHKAKSLKYWEVCEKLENTPYQIEALVSLGDYQERYTISFQESQCQFDAIHNGAGIFHDFKVSLQTGVDWHLTVFELLNQPFNILYNIDYKPTGPVLNELYGLMQSICASEEVAITNIIEKAENYYVMYFLKTDAKCALIQFYFNGQGHLTRALPKSTSGVSDQKLKLLISKIQEHVI